MMPYKDSYLWRLRQKIGSELVLMPGASVLVTNPQGQILLTRRSDEDMWCMPGGAAEEGSGFLDTAIAELREETGIVAERDQFVPFACISDPLVHTFVYANGDRVHCFAMWFALEKWDGKPEARDEVLEVRFFNVSDIPANTLKPSQVALQLYKNYKQTGKFQSA